MGVEEDSALRETVRVSRLGPNIADRNELYFQTWIPRIARDFFESLRDVVHQLQPLRRVLPPDQELLLSRYCYILALFEEMMRNRRSWLQSGSPLRELKQGATLEDLLVLPEDAWIRDVGRMAWLFGRRHSNLFHAKVKVNPAHLSRMYGFGADADLLVNAYIIDIKTSIHPVLEPAWLYQVLGYTLLDLSDSKGIQGVGF